MVEEFDVVVLGNGAAGLSAAVVVAVHKAIADRGTLHQVASRSG